MAGPLAEMVAANGATKRLITETIPQFGHEALHDGIAQGIAKQFRKRGSMIVRQFVAQVVNEIEVGQRCDFPTITQLRGQYADCEVVIG